jgi:uncharacterized surface protein with fasciclin (FAS1) repeats
LKYLLARLIEQLLPPAFFSHVACHFSGKNLTVTDDKGNMAKVTIADVYQSNGVIFVINKVLMPG